eukprot:TRINITY_DN32288_c0_g1_i1.p1 TRINITY_DN32288_c0_g1~~TRINITY_DN32288_c0_g1_i1.p1  ORF type:complete len:579 (+),score=163.80 TRINITY_DN32288_c0_g1_i1:74-1738(+)
MQFSPHGALGVAEGSHLLSAACVLLLAAATLVPQLGAASRRACAIAGAVCGAAAALVSGADGQPADSAARPERSPPPARQEPPPRPRPAAWAELFPLPRGRWSGAACGDAGRPGGPCTAEHLFCALRFSQNLSEWSWDLLAAPRCARPFSQQAAAALLGGRTVVFAGDSNIRALALTVFGMLCNARDLFACHPHNTLHEPQMKLNVQCDPLRCNASGVGAASCSAGHSMRAVSGLTANQTYYTKEERRKWWHGTDMPAAREMRAGGATLLQYAANRPPQVARILRHYAATGTADALVVDMGSHLGLDDFNHRWWEEAAESVREFTAARPAVPVLWAETGWPPNYRHCCACFKRERNTQKRKQETGSYCNDQMEKHKEAIDTALRAAGALVFRIGGPVTEEFSFPFPVWAPGYGERWAESRPTTCLYGDPTHPEVRCMYIMSTLLLNLLAMAWQLPEADAGAQPPDALRGTHWPVRMLRRGTAAPEGELRRVADPSWWASAPERQQTPLAAPDPERTPLHARDCRPPDGAGPAAAAAAAAAAPVPAVGAPRRRRR